MDGSVASSNRGAATTHVLQPRRRGAGASSGPAELRNRARTPSRCPSSDPKLSSSPPIPVAATPPWSSSPETQALVATLDFFTPIVDDAYDWGRIAATRRALRCVRDGRAPFLALNIVAWPVDDLPLEMLGQVLQGGIDVASKAGVAVLGGHTITDPEPKYGMVALGLTDPERIVRNSTVPPGAHLFLTKPLGIGIATTAPQTRGRRAEPWPPPSS